MRTPRTTRLHAAFTALLTVGASAIGVAFASPGAHAATLTTCVGTENLRYAPGLTNAPARTTITLNDVLSPCAQVLPSLWSGSATVSRTIPTTASCLDLLSGGPGSKTVDWSDATTSTFTYNTIVDRVEGQITASETGTISAGRYAGATAIGRVVSPGDLTACSTPAGLANQTGVYSLSIAGL